MYVELHIRSCKRSYSNQNILIQEALAIRNFTARDSEFSNSVLKVPNLFLRRNFELKSYGFATYMKIIWLITPTSDRKTFKSKSINFYFLV